MIPTSPPPSVSSSAILTGASAMSSFVADAMCRRRGRGFGILIPGNNRYAPLGRAVEGWCQCGGVIGRYHYGIDALRNERIDEVDLALGGVLRGARVYQFDTKFFGCFFGTDAGKFEGGVAEHTDQHGVSRLFLCLCRERGHRQNRNQDCVGYLADRWDIHLTLSMSGSLPVPKRVLNDCLTSCDCSPPWRMELPASQANAGVCARFTQKPPQAGTARPSVLAISVFLRLAYIRSVLSGFLRWSVAGTF